MSGFQIVKVQTVVQVEENPAMEKLNVVRFDNGYVTVSSKGNTEVGDKCYVFPAESVLPDEIRDALDLKENRVRAKKIRGVTCDCVAVNLKAVPEAIALKVTDPAADDFGEQFGITKYASPAIEDRPRRHSRKDSPLADTRGQEADRTKNFSKYTMNFDIKNVRHFPLEFGPDEQVVVTEKVHGSWFQICATPEGFFTTSKGLAEKGVAFLEGADNIWTKTVGASDSIRELLYVLVDFAAKLGFRMVSILGEIYGKGVQDLHYGRVSPGAVVFDIAIGHSADDCIFLSPQSVENFCNAFSIQQVPVIYRGPYDQATIEFITKGNSILAPKQIREGVVIRSADGCSSYHLPGGRKILKSINPAHLARGKNADGEEPTECR